MEFLSESERECTLKKILTRTVFTIASGYNVLLQYLSNTIYPIPSIYNIDFISEFGPICIKFGIAHSKAKDKKEKCV